MSAIEFSVVVPHFNSPALLANAVKSVMGQTTLPSELIVVDDASDETHLRDIESICSVAGLGNVEVCLLRNETNVGPGSSRNRGWNAATGTHVAFLDCDDIWHPRKLEISSKFFEMDEDIDFLCHPVVFNLRAWEIKTDTPGWRKIRLIDLLIRNRASTPSVVVRRRLGFRFPSNRRFSEDYELWLKMATAKCRMVEVAAPLASVARSDGHAGLSSSQFKMAFGEVLSMFRALYKQPCGWFLLLPSAGWSLSKSVVRIAFRRRVTREEHWSALATTRKADEF